MTRPHPHKTFIGATADLYCRRDAATRLVFVEISRHNTSGNVTLLPIDAGTRMSVRGGVVIPGAEYDARPTHPADEAHWALERCGFTF